MVLEGVQHLGRYSRGFSSSEWNVVVVRCGWGDWSEETDLEKVCELSNLGFVLKAFGTFEGF